MRYARGGVIVGGGATGPKVKRDARSQLAVPKLLSGLTDGRQEGNCPPHQVSPPVGGLLP